MPIPEIILTPGQRAAVALPWRGSARANFDWLKDVCGERTRPEYDRTSKLFMVARPHAIVVLNALVDEYGRVRVVQHGDSTKTCVERCWNARPDTAIECECGCAGTNHGSRQPMGLEVKSGLSVQHRMTTVTYEVTAAGWRLLDQ